MWTCEVTFLQAACPLLSITPAIGPGGAIANILVTAIFGAQALSVALTSPTFAVQKGVGVAVVVSTGSSIYFSSFANVLGKKPYLAVLLSAFFY